MLDRVFHFSLQTFIERDTAPHFTEIAKAFSVGPEEGKALLHNLMASGIPARLFPGQPVTVSAPCLDCWEPLEITVRDGVVESSNVEGMAAFIDVPFRDCRNNLPYA